MRSERLAIDIGGVVIEEIRAAGGLAHIDDKYLEVPPVVGAREAIRKLQARFDKNIYLVSKARKEVEQNCRNWLAHWRFFEESLVPKDNLCFCRERSEKRVICEALGVTHFVDDKLEVLAGLLGTVPDLYLFNPDPREMAPHIANLGKVTSIRNWNEILERLITI